MNKHRSVAMIDAPEFINLEPDALNPGISKCEIKIFYLGKNRNGSYINKDVAIQMANSLPGTPIVGAYKKDIEDFGDHGHIMHIEDGEITFACKTIPYGFVAPDAQVWFQKFKDLNDFGEEVEREYLMTTGYLWAKQFPEVESCITEGKGQSMELDEETLKGHWATDDNTGIEFFIINDAIFTKLCILGDDVEPCFEGASVTSPEVSKNFSKDADFSKTLFSMMNELKFALQNKGGSDMDKEPVDYAAKDEKEEKKEEKTSEVVDEKEEEKKKAAEGEKSDDSKEKEYACGGTSKKKKYAEDEEKEKEQAEKAQDKQDSAADDDEEEKKKAAVENAKKEEEPVEEEKDAEDEKKKPATKNSLVESLQAQVASMESELEELRQFKLAQEEAKKDALINKYFMLSEEDKAEVIAHKSEYSYEEIDAKLALAYVRKNVDFTTIDGEAEVEVDEEPTLTFSLDEQSAGFVPPAVEALRQVKQNRHNF